MSSSFLSRSLLDLGGKQPFIHNNMLGYVMTSSFIKHTERIVFPTWHTGDSETHPKENILKFCPLGLIPLDEMVF